MTQFKPGDRVLLRADPREAWTVIGQSPAGALFINRDTTDMLVEAARWIAAPEDWEDEPELGLRMTYFDSNNWRNWHQHHLLPLLRQIEEEGR